MHRNKRQGLRTHYTYSSNPHSVSRYAHCELIVRPGKHCSTSMHHTISPVSKQAVGNTRALCGNSPSPTRYSCSTLSALLPQRNRVGVENGPSRRIPCCRIRLLQLQSQCRASPGVDSKHDYTSICTAAMSTEGVDVVRQQDLAL
jgi:hypothetical protein